MSSIREMRTATQTGTTKLDAVPSSPGGMASIRKLREQKLPTQTTVRQTAPFAAPQEQTVPQSWTQRVAEKYQQATQQRAQQRKALQKILDVPEPKESPAPETQGEDWTKAGQRFLQNSPMKHGATPLKSKNDDLQFHRKIVAYAPQVLEAQDRVLEEAIAGYETTARETETTARRLDDIRFYYGSTRNEDGSLGFPTQEGVDAYNQALEKLLGAETAMQSYAARFQETAASRDKAYAAYTQSKDAAFAAYEKLSPDRVALLAKAGDTAAALYLGMEHEKVLSSARSYLNGGGSFIAATELYTAAEQDYSDIAGRYMNAVDALNRYVDGFIQACPNDERRQALSEARDKDLEQGVKLGDDLIATAYSSFFATAFAVGWMDEGFEPEELLAFKELTPDYNAAKKRLEEKSNLKSGVWSIEFEKAERDEYFESLSLPHSGKKPEGKLGEVYDLIAQPAGSYNDKRAFDFNGKRIYVSYFEYMTDDERALFFYYCHTGNVEKAEVLLEGLAGELMYRLAEFTAERMDYPVLRELYAGGTMLREGLISTARGVVSLLPFQVLEPRETDAAQLALGLLQSRHKDSFAGVMIDAAANIGNMAPAALLYSVSPLLSYGVTFLNARGNAYDVAISKGVSHRQAWLYGTCVGAAEAGLEKLLGAMGGFASGKLPKVVTEFFSDAAQSAASKVLTKFGADLAGELLEENLQNYLEPAFAMLVGMADEYDAPDMEEFIETSLVTAMSTLLLSGVKIPSEIERAKYDEQAHMFAAALMKQDKDSAAYQAGVQLLEVLDGFKEGQHINPAYVGAIMRSLGVNYDVGKARKLGRAIMQIQANVQSAERALADNDAVHMNTLVHMVDIRNDSQFTMLPYDDTASQEAIMNDIHSQMTDMGRVVDVRSDHGVEEHYPDLRSMKKEDRNAILKRSISELKTKLKSFLSALKSNNYQFSVNGNILEAKIYDRGIREVTEKLTQDKANMLYQTDEIFKNAEYLYSTPDYDNNPAVYRWDYFYTPVNINGNVVGVRIAVRDVETANQSQIYHWGIKKAPSLDGGAGRQAVSQTSVSSDGAMNSIPRPAQVVNEGNSSAAYADDALIYTALVSLGVHKAAAESLAKNYDPADGISPEIYARGAAEAFFYGKGSFPEAELLNGKGLAPVLTELQRNTAYRLGQIFQERQTTKEEAAIAQKKAAAKKSGSVAQSQKGNVYYDGDHSRLTERQKVSVRALEKLAQALGVDFYLYESERDAAGKPIGANGWYDQKTGDIHIDLNAGELGEGTILFTAAHELTHFLRQWSPSKFKVLSDFLVEQYGAKGQSVSDLVRNQQAKAKRNGRSLRWMQAYEEMVADSMETMLSDGTVIEKLTELSAKDKGLVQKVLDWFKGFSAKLKRAYKDLSADSAEGRLVAEMTDTIDRLQTLFTEGLAQAGENYRMVGGQRNSTAENENAEKHYSFRNSKTGMANDALQPYDTELRNLIENQGNIIVDSYEKLVEVVNRAFDNPKDKATAYFGILDASILVRIEKSIQNLPEALKGILFKQNKQYSVATTLDSIRHLTDNKSVSRNDVIDYLDRLADTIAEFDTVAFDNYTDGMGKRNNGILFKKLFSDGVLQSFSIVSHKKRSLRLVTIYLESGAYQKKKSAKTLPMQNAPAHTLKAGVGQTSTNSISQLPQKNNLQNSNSTDPHSDRGNLTTRAVLMEMDTEQVKNDIAQKYLKLYQENVQLQYAEQKKLVELQEKLDALPVDQRNTDRARDLRNKRIEVKNHIRVYASILTRLETDSPLTYLITREVEPRLAKAQEIAMPQERETLHSGEQAASQSPEMEVFYRVWSKSIGINDAVKTLAEYYDVKYNDSARYELLWGYARAVEKTDISPLVGFEEYERVSKEIQSKIVGLTTQNGITIESFATHFIDRVIGQTSTPHTGMRCGVSIEDVIDTLRNPKSLGAIRQFPDGDIRQTLVGRSSVVTISIRDKRLIQTNPKGE